jgi:hypothetical protein
MTRREEIQKYIMALEKKCPTMNACGVTFATLGDSDGDACLFNGLLASVGYHIGNMGVSESQAREGEYNPGMFYRSPRRRSFGKDQKGEPYFSRDMALGVLCMFASDKHNPYHRTMAENWMDYVSSTSSCKIRKPKFLGGGCVYRTPYKFAPDSDGRSNVSPTLFANLERVWRYRGWRRSYEMEKFKGIDTDLSVIEAELVPKGFELHLKAVQSYIKWKVGQSKEYSIKVGQIAHEKIPDNIFYELLATRKVTDSMLDRFLEMRPSLDMDFGHSWTFEKEEITQERLMKSCGWDFCFLGRLLLQNS